MNDELERIKKAETVINTSQDTPAALVPGENSHLVHSTENWVGPRAELEILRL
jgi:hypothetical protein